MKLRKLRKKTRPTHKKEMLLPPEMRGEALRQAVDSLNKFRDYLKELTASVERMQSVDEHKTTETLTHEEVFGHLEDAVFNVAEVYLYLGDESLFRKFVAYKTRGLLTKAFPPATLKELRQWKKENTTEQHTIPDKVIKCPLHFFYLHPKGGMSHIVSQEVAPISKHSANCLVEKHVYEALTGLELGRVMSSTYTDADVESFLTRLNK